MWLAWNPMLTKKLEGETFVYIVFDNYNIANVVRG